MSQPGVNLKRPVRICFTEETDGNFIRWAANLLLTFLREGSVTIIRQTESPDLMIASIWRKHEFPEGLPVVLLSNENWKIFKPHAPLYKYKAVIGIYPPKQPCNFIPFPYAAVHFDVPVEELYKLRQELLKEKKSEFCCFVASGDIGELAEKRLALFQEINKWKPVHSAGKLLNNVDYRAPLGLDFLRWISRYRYMICLENSKDSKYITEKPFQAWFAGTVPIYDGSCVHLLNPEAIVNASTDDVISRLSGLESQPELYEKKRHANLTATPISLAHFEAKFRKLLHELAAGK